MDLIADPGPALNSASSVKGSDTMFPYPPPGYFLAGKRYFYNDPLMTSIRLNFKNSYPNMP